MFFKKTIKNTKHRDIGFYIMEIQYSKMIIYGFIRALIYLIIPLIAIFILSINDIINFSTNFITYLIIIGSIGIALTVLKHIFPKDTVKNRFIGFAVAAYQGIYLFYIFGGFTPGVKLGTYYITTQQVQVLLWLQLIAWLLLGIQAFGALKHLIEAIEMHKQKEYRFKKQFKISRLFKGMRSLCNLAMITYIITIIISGLNVSFDLKDTYMYSRDDGADAVPWNSDDHINMTLFFDVSNMGLYSIQEVYLDVDIFTLKTADLTNLVLPENVKIGEIKNAYYKIFPAFMLTQNQQITVSIFQNYTFGLISYNATLEFRISLLSKYAGISINLNTSVQTQWDELIV